MSWFAHMTTHYLTTGKLLLKVPMIEILNSMQETKAIANAKVKKKTIDPHLHQGGSHRLIY